MIKIIKVTPFHQDERGRMSYLLDEELKIVNALLITSKKGSIRANHYHKSDSHYCYLISGKMEYYEQSLKKGAKIEKAIIEAGEVVYTPAKKIHAMKFLQDSVFIALTTESRQQEKYEKDLVRIKLIWKCRSQKEPNLSNLPL